MKNLISTQIWVIAAFVFMTPALTACNPPGVSESSDDCDGLCAPFGAQFPGVGECVQGSCTPTFHECFDKTEFSTCEAFCESIGSACAENACADGTYLIHAQLDRCLDPTKEGVSRSGGCSEPIGWQVNEAAQCCCEQ